MASLDPVALQHRGGFEKLDLETRAPAGVGFARQAVGVEDISVEIDGTARRADDGEAQSLGSLAQHLDRLARAAPDALGLLAPDPPPHQRERRERNSTRPNSSH